MIIRSTLKPVLPPAVIRGRREVCRTCPTPCLAFSAGQLNHTDADLACSLEAPRWGAWPFRQAKATTGLGDVVGKLLAPVVVASDKVLGTKLAGCGGCSQRKAKLNQVMPNVLHPFGDKSKS